MLLLNKLFSAELYFFISNRNEFQLNFCATLYMCKIQSELTRVCLIY